MGSHSTHGDRVEIHALQGPGVNIGPPTCHCASEWKTPAPEVHPRTRNSLPSTCVAAGSDVQDPGWNSHSKIELCDGLYPGGQSRRRRGLMLRSAGICRDLQLDPLIVRNQASLTLLPATIAWAGLIVPTFFDWPRKTVFRLANAI